MIASIVNDHFNKLKNIQESLLDYIENDDLEEGFVSLEKFINDQQITANLYEFKAVLHLIVKISNNHHRTSNFFSKIEKIINLFHSSLQTNFSNIEIFRIFQSNKRILLYLFKEKIIIPDISIACSLLSDKNIMKNYPSYFYPEFESLFKQLKNHNDFKYDEIRKFYESSLDSFEDKRIKGENDNYICILIQNDSIEEFVKFVNQTNLFLNSTIKPSIFETNSFLLKNKTITLIQYSAFFGSIQIFKYLFLNKVQIDWHIWFYVIHSQNPELIHFLEEQKIEPPNRIYDAIFYESIRCHHNAISEYIQINLLVDSNNSKIKKDKFSLKYYNFMFCPTYINNDFNSLYNMCKNDYVSIVDLLLNDTELNINSIDIENFTYFFILVIFNEVEIQKIIFIKRLLYQ